MSRSSLASPLLVVAVALGATGCGQILPSSLMASKSADNPLNGAPLKWAQKPTGVPFAGDKDCTIWPIEDELTFSATPEQICVKGRRHRLQAPEAGEPGVGTIVLSSDGGGSSEQLDGRAGAVSSSRPRKIGQCSERGQTKSVWEEPYDGCIANKDKAGKPWLSSTSTFLDAGVERWRFSPAPAEAAAPAAAKSAPPK